MVDNMVIKNKQFLPAFNGANKSYPDNHKKHHYITFICLHLMAHDTCFAVQVKTVYLLNV